MILRFTEENEFLSNFYPSSIRIGGITYPTVEHAFQAHKSLSHGDRRRIAAETTPGRAKRAGRQLELRADWDVVKVGIMAMLIGEKFKDPDLRRMLLDTGSQLLVEGNNWGDTFWGKVNGHGENMLGQILMTRREIERKRFGGRH